MKEDEFLPWHKVQQLRVLEQLKAGKLPHAILIGGPENVGKRHFARALAGLLLCKQPTDSGRCKECAPCHLVSAGTHPDIRVVQPEESKLIKIEQIRDLIDWVSQTSQMGGMKVTLLMPAEQMNISSANALLKCLEEPGPDNLLILVTNQPGRLLPTIRSRCQRLDFPIPRAEDTTGWLRDELDSGNDAELLLGMAGGAPLAVVDRIDAEYLERRRNLVAAIDGLMSGREVVGEVAGRLASTEPADMLEILEGLLVDALKNQMTENKKYIKNKDLEDLVDRLSKALDRRFLLDMIRQVTAERRAVQGPSNPNIQLLLEGLLIELSKGWRL